VCGIVALFKQQNVARPLSLARAMSDRVAHRGRDGAGWVGLADGAVTRSPESTAWYVAPAHRRLSTIDASPAAQPLSYRGRYLLTYNGDIYNHLEFRAELERLGHAFRTASDSEVLLAAFAEWGTRCFQRMRGMWGLVLVDTQSKTGIVCRDRQG
jgi:asparagine synthase (glutamine-hydrolysing)